MTRKEAWISGPWEYERAYNDVLRRAVSELVRRDAFVGDIPTKRSKHRGHVRLVYEGQNLDRTSSTYKVEAEIPSNDVRHARIDSHTGFVRAIAHGKLKQLVPQVSELIAQTTDFTGRALPPDERAFTWDRYLMALDRIEISFDDDGGFELPQIHMGPELSREVHNMPFPPDFEGRFEALIERKREEWFAAKRSRRLSRSSA